MRDDAGVDPDRLLFLLAVERHDERVLSLGQFLAVSQLGLVDGLARLVQQLVFRAAERRQRERFEQVGRLAGLEILPVPGGRRFLELLPPVVLADVEADDVDLACPCARRKAGPPPRRASLRAARRLAPSVSRMVTRSSSVSTPARSLMVWSRLYVSGVFPRHRSARTFAMNSAALTGPTGMTSSESSSAFSSSDGSRWP
jgi:hypothetical protein